MTSQSRLVIPRLLKVPFLLSFLISSVLTLLVLVAYFRVQPQVPLFYTLARPSQQLVAKEWLFLFPILSFAISLVHLSIARWLYPQTRVIVQLFSWMTVAIQVTLALSLIRVLVIIS